MCQLTINRLCDVLVVKIGKRPRNEGDCNLEKRYQCLIEISKNELFYFAKLIQYNYSIKLKKCKGRRKCEK